MKLDLMPETETMGDAELVQHCLNGDREAFGQIVSRYQTVVCALAYSACGDMGRSEDLAQEIFLKAWRNLRTLKEPGRLKAWLCGIARNMINYSFREEARNPVAVAEPLEETLDNVSQAATASEETMSREEAALLWRVLEGLPRAYRDPMVLYYRNDDSVTEVAETLEISEEAVRQRLSRGRGMLNERMTKLVESGLRRSGPSQNFSAAVLAALPVLGAQTGAAGVVATAAKGSTTSAAGVLGPILAAVPGIIPVLGGLIGLWGHVQNTRSPKERRFTLVSAIGLIFWAAGVALCGLWYAFHGGIDLTRYSDSIAAAVVWIAICGPLDAYAIWMARRQRQLRIEQGLQPLNPAFTLVPGKGLGLTVYGTLAALIFGTTGWLLMLAYHAHDWLAFGFTAGLTVTGWLTVAQMILNNPQRLRKVYIWVLWGLMLFLLIILNARWSGWTGASDLYSWPTDFAPPSLSFIIIIFFGSIRIGWFLKEKIVPAENVKSWTIKALTAYCLLLLLGMGGFYVAKAVEPPPPSASQDCVDEILPDGTIRFTITTETPNLGRISVEQFGFVNSDFVHVEKMSDSKGRPLQFTSTHDKDIFRYDVKFNNPVPPKAPIIIKMEGYMTGQIKALPNKGEFEYSEQHWPANGINTRRTEAYRLPAGATVLELYPPEIHQEVAPDGRTELRISKLIPPRGHIRVTIKYKLQGS